MIELSRDDWSLALRPELGAAVTRLTWRERDILRPTSRDPAHPLETGCFPLVPYANRIDRGAFHFAGRDILLPATAGFEPHALHGLGWLRPWRVARSDETSVDLILSSGAAADWPWDWTASLRLGLQSDGVDMALSLTNEDARPMPAGLGLHPYFALERETVLSAAAPQVWVNGADEIPQRLAAASDIIDWGPGAPVASAPFVDNAYAGWGGTAELRHAGHTVVMTASPNARWMQIYAPGSGDFVCLEPVTHRPDAHNAPDREITGLAVLGPGQTLSMSMRITASENALMSGEDR